MNRALFNKVLVEDVSENRIVAMGTWRTPKGVLPAYRSLGMTSSAKYFIERMAFSCGMLPQAKTLMK